MPPRIRVPLRPRLPVRSSRPLQSRLSARGTTQRCICTTRPLAKDDNTTPQEKIDEHLGRKDKEPEFHKEQKGPNMDPLPHVSEEAAAVGDAMGGGGPQVEQGTKVQDVVENHGEIKKHLPKVMRDELKQNDDKSKGGSRSFSTFSRIHQSSFRRAFSTSARQLEPIRTEEEFQWFLDTHGTGYNNTRFVSDQGEEAFVSQIGEEYEIVLSEGNEGKEAWIEDCNVYVSDPGGVNTVRFREEEKPLLEAQEDDPRLRYLSTDGEEAIVTDMGDQVGITFYKDGNQIGLDKNVWMSDDGNEVFASDKDGSNIITFARAAPDTPEERARKERAHMDALLREIKESDTEKSDQQQPEPANKMEGEDDVIPAQHVPLKLLDRAIQRVEETLRPGLKFHSVNLPLPPGSKLRDRIDPVVDQVTRTIMKDGKLSVAQKHMNDIFAHLRTSPAPKLSQRYPLLPNAPSPAHLPLLPVHYLTLAIDSIGPLFRMRSQRGAAGGGVALEIPVPLGLRQRRRQAIAWIMDAVNKKGRSSHGLHPFAKRFADEIIAVVEGRSAAWDKRTALHALGVRARANLNITKFKRNKQPS